MKPARPRRTTDRFAVVSSEGRYSPGYSPQPDFGGSECLILSNRAALDEGRSIPPSSTIGYPAVSSTVRQVPETPVQQRFMAPRWSAPPAPVQELPRRSATELLREAQRRMVDLYRDLDDLHAGTGDWADTPARTLDDADRRLAQARRVSEDPDARRRDRRATAKAIPQLEAALDAAQQNWDEHGAPEEHQLERQVAAAKGDVAKLTPATNAEHLERIQARATERAAGLDRGIGL